MKTRRTVKRVSSSVDDTGWTYDVWDDGTEQVFRDTRDDRYIERVVRPNSRRVRWTIVSRIDAHDYTLYPPKVAGPFATLDAAKAAFLVTTGVI